MDSPSLLLTHDIAITGNKASLFDAQRVWVSCAFVRYAANYPQPRWAEQDAELAPIDQRLHKLNRY